MRVSHERIYPSLYVQSRGHPPPPPAAPALSQAQLAYRADHPGRSSFPFKGRKGRISGRAQLEVLRPA
jgi:hypothetical protein